MTSQLRTCDWIIGGSTGLVIGTNGMKRWGVGYPSVIVKKQLQKVLVHGNVPAHAEQGINQVESVALPAKQVIAYKAEAKEQLRLTKEIQDALEQQVLSAATVKPDAPPQTVTTVLDTRTGESREFVQAEPLPWLA